jgi:hypothetical protein
VANTRTKGPIQESFDRCVADKIRGYPRPKTFPIEFEWNPPERKTVAARCWNGHFWYGGGEPATEPSVIIRKSDFDKLLRDARRGAA